MAGVVAPLAGVAGLPGFEPGALLGAPAGAPLAAPAGAPPDDPAAPGWGGSFSLASFSTEESGRTPSS